MIYLRALEPTLFLNENANQDEINANFININQLKNKGLGAHTNLVLAYFNKDEIKQVSGDINLGSQTQIGDSEKRADVTEEIDSNIEINDLIIVENPNKLETQYENNDLEVIDIDEAIEEIIITNSPEVQSFDVDEDTPEIKNKKKAKKKKKNKDKKSLGKIANQALDLPNDEFILWIFQLNPIQGSMIPKAKKPKKKSKVEIEVAKSILISEDIASENLAFLYEQQGHIDKALEMFHKLNLKYPEKSSYFAAKILELKSKIKND